jgi:hypothetical protein
MGKRAAQHSVLRFFHLASREAKARGWCRARLRDAHTLSTITAVP